MLDFIFLLLHLMVALSLLSTGILSLSFFLSLSGYCCRPKHGKSSLNKKQIPWYTNKYICQLCFLLCVYKQDKFLTQLWVAHPDTFYCEEVRKLYINFKIQNLTSSRHLRENKIETHNHFPTVLRTFITMPEMIIAGISELR